MNSSTPDNPEVLRFVELATAYCTLLSGHDPLPAREFLIRVHRLLAPLYDAALGLPDLGGTDADCEGDGNAQLTLHQSLRSKLSGRDYYLDVFDPFDQLPNVPGTAMLSDDLGDTYGELAAGLECWNRGQRSAAVWHWRFGFQTHWGRHLVAALRALHALTYTYDLDVAGPSSPEA